MSSLAAAIRLTFVLNDMGNVMTTVEEIATFGDRVLREYYGRSTFGQMTQALSASDHCERPVVRDNIPDYFRCSLLKANKGAWEIILTMYIIMAILLMAFATCHIAMLVRKVKKSKKATNQISQCTMFPMVAMGNGKNNICRPDSECSSSRQKRYDDWDRNDSWMVRA